jgi:hypothetical protein
VNRIILLLMTVVLLAGCGKHSGGDVHSTSLLKTIEAAARFSGPEPRGGDHKIPVPEVSSRIA